MKKNTIIKSALVASGLLLLFSSFKSDKPEQKPIDVVKPFDQKKYLGKWYEIARLDYYWEKDLDNVTATYSLNVDSTIKVDNKGFDLQQGEWEESVGKAKAVGDPNEGRLKVSFFGPFYSDYNVVELDKDYKYALVAGESTKYLWILSREKTIPDATKNKYLKKAQELGYNINDLVWVKHDKD